MTGNTNTVTDFRNTILNGDSVELMRTMPRNSVDFILTDPACLFYYVESHRRQSPLFRHMPHSQQGSLTVAGFCRKRSYQAARMSDKGNLPGRRERAPVGEHIRQ